MSINLDRLRRIGFKVERRVGQDLTEPADQLAEIEASQLRNFVFKLPRPDGQEIPIPRRQAVSLSEAGIITITPPSGRMVVHEAYVNAVRRSVDTSRVKTVIYPGCGNDSETVRDIVQMFPNLENLVLIDPQYKTLHRISDDLSVGWIAAGGVDMNSALEVGVLGKKGKLEVDASHGAHDFKIHLYSEDYLRFISSEMRAGVDAFIVMQPGQAAELSYKRNFYRKAAAEMKLGALMLVRRAKLPESSVFEKVEANVEGIPEKEKAWMWEIYRKRSSK